MKKGRHRRFEEARKLKQSGPAAFGWEPRPSSVDEVPPGDDDDENEYAALAKKYGVTFEDDDEDDDA